MFTEKQSPANNNETPLNSPSRLARLFHVTEFRILLIGFRQLYRSALLYKLDAQYEVENALRAFNAHRNSRGDGFGRSLVAWLAPNWAMQSLGFSVDQLLGFVHVFALRAAVRSLRGDRLTLARVVSQALGFVLLSAVRGFVQVSADAPVVANSLRVEAVLYAAYFSKLERLQLCALRPADIGGVKSALTTDAARLTRAVSTSHHIVSSPVILIAVLVYVQCSMGWRGTFGLAIFVAVGLLQQGAARAVLKLLAQKKKLAEERSCAFWNLLSGIQTIKFNAWEGAMATVIDRLRRSEGSVIARIVFLRNSIDGLYYALPLIATLLLVAIAQRGDGMRLEDVVATMSLLGLLISPLRHFTAAMIAWGEAREVLRSAELFLSLPEEPTFPCNEPVDSTLVCGELVLSGVTAGFAIEGSAPTALISGVELRLRPGELVGVVGRVGSGKSILLKSAMGLTTLIEGSLRRKGKVAYISQDSFLISGSIRDNILFGRPMKEKRYQKVVSLCQLATDLTALPLGDLTKTGESGVALSAGQRQRIAIARAVYSRGDIYIVDDCLSALDNRVCQAIFRDVFCRYLRGRTILIVTNALQYLKRLDRIVIVEGGAVVGQGTYAELLENPYFSRLLEKTRAVRAPTFQDVEEVRPQRTSLRAYRRSHVAENFRLRSMAMSTRVLDEGEEALLVEELVGNDVEGSAQTDLEGLVGWRVYLKYLLSGDWRIFCINMIAMFGAVIVKMAADSVVARQSATVGLGRNSLLRALFVRYLTLFTSLTVLILLRAVSYARYVSNSSQSLLSRFVRAVLGKRMSFFTETSAGQLLSLASKDIDHIDVQLPLYFMSVFILSFQLVEAVIQAARANPLTAPILCVFISTFCFLLFVYLKTSSELGRMQQWATAPMLSHALEFYEGLPFFRCYGQAEFYRSRFAGAANHLLCVVAHDRLVGYYALLLVELLAGFMVASIVLLIGAGRVYKWRFAADDSARIAVALSVVLRVPALLPSLFYAMSETARGMGAVQRVIDGAKGGEKEPSCEAAEVPVDWPSAGAVQISCLSARYAPELPLVLRRISLNVCAGEKVGVVGRTGSGKSSLLLALTRIIEAEPESAVLIDGVDTRTVGVRSLRRAIEVVPQEAFCFKGTLRENIDPCNAYSDKEIAGALSKTQFWETVAPADDERVAMESGRLDLRVEESGKNLSVGTRQLISLARSVLAKPKLLLMDEATANIDYASELRIQNIIRREFASATVISVAHRLHTVVQFDRLVVVDRGRIVEVGAPADLLSRESLFRNAVRENGPLFVEKLLQLSLNKNLSADAELCDAPPPSAARLSHIK